MIRRTTQNRSGMALVVTVAVIALLTIAVFDFFYSSWIQSALAAGFRDETRALYAARSGQNLAKLILREDAKKKIKRDALTDEWAQNGMPIPFDEEFAFVTIKDESGKLDLNQLTSDQGYPQDRWIVICKRFFTSRELPPELCDAVVDWIDPNSEERQGGAEDGYYVSQKEPYQAKNARLDSVEELAMIKGFTPEVMKKIRDTVTVWSGGKININTAPPEALLALDDDMTGELVKSMILARTEKPFASREDIKRVAGMEPIYPKIALAIDVVSDYFSVESLATFGETTKHIRAVYKRSAANVEILYYKVF